MLKRLWYLLITIMVIVLCGATLAGIYFAGWLIAIAFLVWLGYNLVKIWNIDLNDKK